MQKVKLHRINKGYYRGTYKSVDFVICRVYEVPVKEPAWYWQITGPVHDWYGSKESALSAVIDFIDSQK
jgi:hypothetical protein